MHRIMGNYIIIENILLLAADINPFYMKYELQLFYYINLLYLRPMPKSCSEVVVVIVPYAPNELAFSINIVNILIVPVNPCIIE